MTKTINFYRVNEPYGCFSNFAPYSVTIDGLEWPTTEHYFQAQKFAGSEHEETICNAPTPMAAARMGRDRELPLRADWEEVKDNIMRDAVLAKFTQHEELRDILLSTGDALLVEHTQNDRYWADGGDGTGRSMFGQILMDLREQLRNAAG